MGVLSDQQRRRAVGRGERVGERGRAADRRDVVVCAASLDVELDVGPHTHQVERTKCHPIPQTATRPQERVRGDARPAADLLRGALTETHLVTLVPTPFGCIPGVFPIQTGAEVDLGQRHLRPLKFSCATDYACGIQHYPRHPLTNVSLLLLIVKNPVDHCGQRPRPHIRRAPNLGVCQRRQNPHGLRRCHAPHPQRGIAPRN